MAGGGKSVRMAIRRVGGKFIHSSIAACDDGDFSSKVWELRGVEFGHFEVLL